MQPLLVRNLQIPHIHLLVRNQAMTVGRQTCLHPGHCRSRPLSHGLWCGVSGHCSSMSWSLPRPLTESGPLLNQSKYSAPRQCTRSFISWTLKHLSIDLWRYHHSRHHGWCELEVITERGQSSGWQVNPLISFVLEPRGNPCLQWHPDRISTLGIGVGEI